MVSVWLFHVHSSSNTSTPSHIPSHPPHHHSLSESINFTVGLSRYLAILLIPVSIKLSGFVTSLVKQQNWQQSFKQYPAKTKNPFLRKARYLPRSQYNSWCCVYSVVQSCMFISCLHGLMIILFNNLFDGSVYGLWQEIFVFAIVFKIDEDSKFFQV